MIILYKSDILSIPADVIVNSANPSLTGIGPDLPKGVGGVDGAIHRAAGIALYNACMKFPVTGRDKLYSNAEHRCPEGQHRVTEAFNINAKYIIHAVSPINLPPYNQDGIEERLHTLDRLYTGIFAEFSGMKANSILLPPLGTRSFGMPPQASAQIATDHAKRFAAKHPDRDIFFTVIDPTEHGIYRRFLPHPVGAPEGPRT